MERGTAGRRPVVEGSCGTARCLAFRRPGSTPLPHRRESALSANIEELERRRAAARQGGGAKRVAAQHAKGKLTARERLEVLLDEGSFEELEMYVEHNCTDFGMETQRIPDAVFY